MPDPARRPATGSRSSAAVRRQEILRAAAVEFAVGGLAGTSTEAIARRAGVSQAYLFRLFGTKKALFVGAVERGFARVEQAFREAAATAEGQGQDPFAAMASTYLELLADREQLLLQLHAYAACGDAEVREAVRQGFGSLWAWARTLPGASAEVVQQFFAMGMLLNVCAAQDLMELISSQAWAEECMQQRPLGPAPGRRRPDPAAPGVAR